MQLTEPVDIDQAEAAIVRAWSFHDRQCELHAEFGEGTESVDYRAHYLATLKLGRSLAVLIGHVQAGEALKVAHRRNVVSVHGN